MVTRLGRSPLAGVLVALASVVLSTALIYALDDIAPVVSLGVIYLVGVLLVSSIWGVRLGIATAIVSALAFNWFHIPPTGRFTVSEGENWVALGALLVVAVVTSSLAQNARSRAQESEQRRQEADLAAEMARLLLRGGRLEEALPTVSQRLAAALALSSASIDVGAIDSDDRRVAFPLREHTRRIGTLVVPADASEQVLSRIQVRVVPQLEALLAAALERDELIGDVVETAALRRSDVLKTALLRAVSHDLRSPLTAILTAADALDSPSISPDERADMTRAIREEAVRLSRLIDNLLDLSRLEAHAAEPQREWCSIEEILEAAVAELGLSGDRFTFSIAADLPQVRADAAQLDRAFANLLENSARHSGGHPVSVRARAVGERVLVRIVDRGPGIPSAQLERVFQPFYRAGTDRTGHRGSGLGLAIARGFIEVNGGKVWAESLPGQATTFVVEMPLDVAGEPTEAEPTAAT
jgi:two-component system, OmpR family, sensor histidine kinase KdpD